jgi:DNA-binding winged helix-turn-helix (wHTH) protein
MMDARTRKSQKDRCHATLDPLAESASATMGLLVSTPSDDNSGQGESVANRYRFGRFVLDTASQQLFGDDDSTTELPLSPKAFRVLTLLVENVGDVITKDQLLDEVWADTVVLEGVVKVCIAELRRALGERAARPHHLHTVQRRGYRFEGPVVLEARPVQRAEAATVPVPASSSSAPAPMARRSIRQSGPTPPTHGELRQLAIIYCEVTERQALAANIGDEATAKLVDAAHQTCLAIVRSLGGSIAQPLDGGLIAYFGYPTAYEDDTNRALRVALRILERTAALNARQARRDEPGSQPGLELGIGVHSGSVEVGAGGDVSGIPREQVVGIAERLARIGSPGTLSITSSTSRLVHGAYELQPIGEHAITDEQNPSVCFAS